MVTSDRLLGGRIVLAQPDRGYRVAIDPILLAAATAPEPGERVLDAGCGAGAAALCLAARDKGCSIVGVESDPGFAALAQANVAANGFGARIEIAEDSMQTFARARAGAFDRLMANPPFHAQGRHTRSDDPGKARAHGETDLTLAGWIAAGAIALRQGGVLTLIHRADRIGEILAALDGRFGAVILLPLWPRAGEEAKRVVISAVKGRKTAPRLLPGLILHQDDGRYTEAAEAILRNAAALDFPSPAGNIAR